MSAAPYNVVIDARWIFPQLSGIGTYTLELLKNLAREHTDAFRFHVWVGSRERQEFILTAAGLSDKGNFLFAEMPYGVFDPRGQWAARRYFKQHDIALYHSTNFMIPFLAFGGANRKTRCVCNIHDLIPLVHPEFTPRALKTRFFWVYKTLMNQIARHTNRVLTGSDSARQDIIRELKMPSERITVIPDGVGEQFIPTDKKPSDATGVKIILYVGRSDPYKNLTGLVAAFARMLERTQIHVRLRIVGSPDPRYPEAMALAEQLGINDKVEWSGYIDDAELLSAYQDADVLALLSRYEGFGLPVLEAMACGTPVVCSRVTSLPEVVGDAASLVDPDNLDECAEALQRILEDEDYARRLRQAGLARARQFSWPRHAQRVLSMYADMLDIGGHEA